MFFFCILLRTLRKISFYEGIQKITNFAPPYPITFREKNLTDCFLFIIFPFSCSFLTVNLEININDLHNMHINQTNILKTDLQFKF